MQKLSACTRFCGDAGCLFTFLLVFMRVGTSDEILWRTHQENHFSILRLDKYTRQASSHRGSSHPRPLAVFIVFLISSCNSHRPLLNPRKSSGGH